MTAPDLLDYRFSQSAMRSAPNRGGRFPVKRAQYYLCGETPIPNKPRSCYGLGGDA